MKVSVALCTYNGSAYVAEQLASIARQTQLPDEVVICDDRSEDDTLALARKFADSAPFPVIVHVNETNRGSNRNFEGAVRRCTGDIIFLSDQDDIWREDKVERMCREFRVNANAGLVFSDAAVVDRDGQALGYSLWQSIYFRPRDRHNFKRPKFRKEFFFRRSAVTGAASAFRASFVPKLFPVPEGWIHDWWISLVIANVSEIVPIAEPLLFYRQHGGNQIGASKPKKWVWPRPEDVLQGVRLQLGMARTAKEALSQNLNMPSNLLDGRINHLELRLYALMTKSIWHLCKELVASNYNKYSPRCGIKAFAIDLYVIFADYNSVPRTRGVTTSS